MRTLAPCLVCGRDVATDTRPVVCYDCQENDISTQDMKVGQAWRENSSLENWFPYSAEEIQKLRALVTEVYLVASGERQVTNDDTSALAWIAERCKTL